MAGPSTGAELALVGAGGEPVDLWRTISSHGVADLPPNRIDDEQRTLEVTLAVARGKPRTAVISQGRPGYARVEMRGGKPDAVLDTVRHLLGLDADLSSFYELVAADPDLAWVANGAGRMLRSPTVFEEVVKTICTTNCAWSGTVRMVSSLVEHLGTPSAGASPGPFGRAFPTPDAMAEAGVDFYRDIARAGYRGAYLRELAASVADGELDIESFAAGPDELPAETYHAMAQAALAGMNPLSKQKREFSRLFYANAMSMELDGAGRIMLPARFLEHAGIGSREVVVAARATAWSCGIAPPGSPTTPTWRSARLTSPHHLAILLDMPKTHVPVLAGELIEGLDPQPGQIAVDCTLGAGGHARLLAGRLGHTGLLIGIDRDPLAEEAFAELAAEAPCRTRFVRADFASGLEHCSTKAFARTWSISTSECLDAGRYARARVLLRLRRTARHAHGPAQPVTAAEIVNTWEPRRLGRVLRDYGEERYADRIAKEIVRRAAAGELTTTFELVDAITAAIPVPARFAGGHPAKRTFQAIRIAVNDELSQLERGAAARLGPAAGRRPPRRDLVPFARGSARQAVPRRPHARLHLPARPARLRLRPDAAGRAGLPPLGRAHAGRDRRQRALAVGPPARRAQALRRGVRG